MAAVIVNYYRIGMSSAEICGALHLPTATYVRQLLHRLHATWSRLQHPAVQKANEKAAAKAVANADVVDMICKMRACGIALRKIAEILSGADVRTSCGTPETRDYVTRKMREKK